MSRPFERMLAFCRAEYAYYDAIPSEDASHIDPIDVLATVAMNSFVNSATKVRQVHHAMAESCDPLLPTIPEEADLVDLDRWREPLHRLLDAAVQVSGVLIPVATKVLHRKRRRLIPMLDGVILRYLLDTEEHRPLLARTESGATAAAVAMVALDRFQTDLVATSPALERLSGSLAEEGFPLSLVRILEVLVWTEVEPGGYYRLSN